MGEGGAAAVVVSAKHLVAKRYALKLNPPAVVLEYAEGSKTRLRTVKLLELSTASDVEKLTTKVLRSFPRQLDPTTVSISQVRRLVERLKEKTTGPPTAAGGGGGSDDDDDFNLTEGPARRASMLNLVREGGEGAASPTATAAAAVAEEEEEEEELDLAQEAEIDLNDPNLDLNKVSIAQLKAAKKKMEVEFKRNQKLPGEDGFSYDVQVDYQFAEGEGDWDDSGDEDAE